MANFNHISSNSLKIFPISTVRSSDTNARLFTELNITSLMNAVNSRRSFVISSDLSEGIFEFMISGYYFCINNGQLNNALNGLSGLNDNKVYASIRILNENSDKATLMGADSNNQYNGLYITAKPDSIPDGDDGIQPTDNESIVQKDLLILKRNSVSSPWYVPDESRNINDVIDGGYID